MDLVIVLEQLAITDGDMSPAPDLSSYAKMKATWRNPAVAIPALAECQAAQATYDAGQASRDALAALAGGDAGMIRVIEDLLAVLVAKGVLAEADLPADAQSKIQGRRTSRGQL